MICLYCSLSSAIVFLFILYPPYKSSYKSRNKVRIYTIAHLQSIVNTEKFVFVIFYEPNNQGKITGN